LQLKTAMASSQLTISMFTLRFRVPPEHILLSLQRSGTEPHRLSFGPG
jgi:hypothetical protein